MNKKIIFRFPFLTIFLSIFTVDMCSAHPLYKLDSTEFQEEEKAMNESTSTEDFHRHPLIEIAAPEGAYKSIKETRSGLSVPSPKGELTSSPPLPTSYKKLLEYILPAPDQHQGTIGTSSYVNAGSCLFMAVTGAAEILLNMDYPLEDRVSDGETDLSERWAMNVGDYLFTDNWLQDKILIYNHYKGALLNQDYRYTKGNYYFKYSLKVNWKNYLPKNWQQKMIKMPTIEREVLYSKSTSSSRYDVAVINDATIQKVKQALVEKRGPVLVVYNDSEYWHVVVIVGYDDNDTELNPATDSRSCPFVRDMLPNLNYTHQKLIKAKMAKEGCQSKGVFYVRESEHYPDKYYTKSDKIYDYDLSRTGEEQPYVGTYVKRGYDWLKYLGNHVISVYRPDVDSAPFAPAKDLK